MRTTLGCALVLTVALCVASTAQSATLLGSVPYPDGGGTTSAHASDVATVALEIGYSSNITAVDCSQPMLGCDGIPLASLTPGAVFTFDATHGTNFALIASRLTNGSDEILWFETQLRDAAGKRLDGGNVGGKPESEDFGRATDFTGNTITSITLTIHSFEIDASWTAACGGIDPPGIVYCLNSEWKVYGTSNATPVSAASWGAFKSHYR